MIRKNSIVTAIILFSALIFFSVAEHFCFTINPLNYLQESYQTMVIYDFKRECMMIFLSLIFILSLIIINKRNKESIVIQILSCLALVDIIKNNYYSCLMGCSIVKNVVLQEQPGINVNDLNLEFEYREKLSLLTAAFVLLLILSMLRNVIGLKFLNNIFIRKIIDYPVLLLLFLPFVACVVFVLFSFLLFKRDITLVELILTYICQGLMSVGIAKTIILRNSYANNNIGMVQIVKSFIKKEGEPFESFRRFVIEPDDYEE